MSKNQGACQKSFYFPHIWIDEADDYRHLLNHKLIYQTHCDLTRCSDSHNKLSCNVSLPS